MGWVVRGASEFGFAVRPLPPQRRPIWLADLTKDATLEANAKPERTRNTKLEALAKRKPFQPGLHRAPDKFHEQISQEKPT